MYPPSNPILSTHFIAPGDVSIILVSISLLSQSCALKTLTSILASSFCELYRSCETKSTCGPQTIKTMALPTGPAAPLRGPSTGEPHTWPPAFLRSKTAPPSAPSLATSSPARNAEHDSDSNYNCDGAEPTADPALHPASDNRPAFARGGTPCPRPLHPSTLSA